MNIAVIGAGDATVEEGRLAFEAGFEVARRGHTLICGGRGGVMREACRGAREAGGHTIGILPGADRAEANEYVEFAIVTGLGEARNTIVVRTADALIAIGGRYGTLSEIAFAFICGKPVAGLGTWQICAPDGSIPPLALLEDATAAVAYCEQAAKG